MILVSTTRIERETERRAIKPALRSVSRSILVVLLIFQLFKKMIMKEMPAITKLFTDLYAGDPWIGVNLVDSLKNIEAKKTNKKVRLK